MTQLADLVSRLWCAGQACTWIAHLTGWRSLYRWARVLLTGSVALAWSLTWVGGTVVLVTS